MKKIVVSCLAMSLIFSSGLYVKDAGAAPPHKNDSPASVQKKTGLENALSKGNKNDVAKAAIQRNMVKKEGKMVPQPVEPVPADVTLSTLTIGGLDASKLEGLSTSAGATLEVAEFTNFKGISFSTNNKDVNTTVSVNNYVLQPDRLANFMFRSGDKIVITVKDGSTTQTYTIQLVSSVDLSLNKFTIGGLDVSKLSELTTTKGAIFKVDSFSNFNGIEIQPKNNQANVTISLNGDNLPSSQWKDIQLLNNDVIIVTVKEGSNTLSYKITLVKDAILKLDQFKIGDKDITNLSGLTSASGALLQVRNSDDLRGLDVLTTDNNADITININDVTYSPSQYRDLAFRVGDRVALTVKNGQFVEVYKVKLINEADYPLKKFTVGGIELSTWAGLTTTNGAEIKLEQLKNLNGITVEAKDADATVTISVNDTVILSGLSNFALRANDKIVAKIKEGDTTQTFQVTIR
ncbi:hypothetical protein [Ammoniphilus sp. CFH 90114]|uniref:hypothetical protein n=1 Tax=Ammoniphilus sp. CFH 90114 TaxID=2493665 RepID=UPI00100F7308|nr:hypothetical protein [Ammoniphilus sp. CFH 90114]RXT06392.1 hypothetical protein EIZ39_15085 [Ammoniphilus sp. CFH 90114]